MIHIENLSTVVIIYWHTAHTPTVMMMIIMLGQVLHNVHSTQQTQHGWSETLTEAPNLNINRVFMNAGCWWEMVPVLNPLIAPPTPPPTPPHPLGGSSPQPAGRMGCYSQVSTRFMCQANSRMILEVHHWLQICCIRWKVWGHLIQSGRRVPVCTLVILTPASDALSSVIWSN